MGALAPRISYLNFFLAATLGICFWYRGLLADKALGSFLLIVSLIFLFQTGVSDNMDHNVGGRLILFGLWLSVLALTLGAFITMPVFSGLIVLVVVLLFLYYTIMAFSTTDDFKCGYSEWTRNGLGLMSEGEKILFLVVLYGILFYLAYLISSSGLFLVSLLSLAVTLFLSTKENFYYQLILSLLIFLTVYWFLFFFSGTKIE